MVYVSFKNFIKEVHADDHLLGSRAEWRDLTMLHDYSAEWLLVDYSAEWLLLDYSAEWLLLDYSAEWHYVPMCMSKSSRKWLC